MINIMKCNNIDLNTLIELNQIQISRLKNAKKQFPFIGGDIKRLQKENKELTFLINHLNN